MVNELPPEIHRIDTEEDVSTVRFAVKTMAQAAGLSLVNQTKIITAASELARNALIYGGGGSASVQNVYSGLKVGVRIVISDQGPGISDLETAFSDGFTSGGGMGLGLGGAKRLSDEFSIETSAGNGTRISIVKWN